MANSILVRRGEEFSINEHEVEEKLGMPCFVKPAADGSSFGVSKVKNIDQLAPALRKALMEDESAVIESFLDGTEFCGLLSRKRRNKGAASHRSSEP